MVESLCAANLAILDPILNLFFFSKYGSKNKLQAALAIEIKVNYDPAVQNETWGLNLPQ